MSRSRIAFLTSLATLCITGIVIHTLKQGSIETQIIHAIDKQCAQEGSCYISLSELTDFQWDTVSIFIAGGSSQETSAALGFYTELENGIVFYHNNEVVKKHTSSYDYFKNNPPKLSYWIERTQGDPYYKSYTYEEASILAQKIKRPTGKYRYQLTVES